LHLTLDNSSEWAFGRVITDLMENPAKWRQVRMYYENDLPIHEDYFKFIGQTRAIPRPECAIGINMGET
jgi:hypothetical protein